MKEKTITTISFLYKGESIRVEANLLGKFRVPVTEVRSGTMRTIQRSLTAREIVRHPIIKNCDPTLYIAGGERMRVYLAGDSSYLPAASDGVILKHDAAFRPKKGIKENRPNKKKEIQENRYEFSHHIDGLFGFEFDDYDFSAFPDDPDDS